MLNNIELENRLFSMLPKELKVPRAELTRESRLDEIGLDSLDFIQFMFEVQDEFNIRFDDSAKLPETLGAVFEKIEEAINNVQPQS